MCIILLYHSSGTLWVSRGWKKKKILRKEKNCCPWMETVWKTFLLFETSILLMIPQKINWRKKCAIETVKWAVCVDFYHPYYHWRINVENGDFFCSKKKKKMKKPFWREKFSVHDGIIVLITHS